jgi:hypothetical protein
MAAIDDILSIASFSPASGRERIAGVHMNDLSVNDTSEAPLPSDAEESEI